jgi:uncharacterized membrane protein
MKILQVISLLLLIVIAIDALFLAITYYRPHRMGTRRVDKYGYKGLRTRIIILCVLSYALTAFVVFVK